MNTIKSKVTGREVRNSAVLAGMACCIGLVAANVCSADSGPTQYSYDDSNRLIQATNATGDAAQLQFDANGNVISASGVTPTAITLGNAQNVQIGTAGANAVLDFSVAANSPPLALSFSGLTTTPGNSPISVDVYNPSGTLVASAVVSPSTPAWTLPTLPPGAYTVVVAPQDAATASMQVTLANASADNGPSSDGPIPLWAYVVLGAGLIWVGRRAEQRVSRVV